MPEVGHAMQINPELQRRFAQQKSVELMKQASMLNELHASRNAKNVRPSERIFIESSKRMLRSFKRLVQQEQKLLTVHPVDSLDSSKQNT
jgi:hypothetical protein